MSGRRTHPEKEEAKHNADSMFVIGGEGFPRRRKPWRGGPDNTERRSCETCAKDTVPK